MACAAAMVDSLAESVEQAFLIHTALVSALCSVTHMAGVVGQSPLTPSMMLLYWFLRAEPASRWDGAGAGE